MRTNVYLTKTLLFLSLGRNCLLWLPTLQYCGILIDSFPALLLPIRALPHVNQLYSYCGSLSPPFLIQLMTSHTIVTKKVITIVLSMDSSMLYPKKRQRKKDSTMIIMCFIKCPIYIRIVRFISLRSLKINKSFQNTTQYKMNLR